MAARVIFLEKLKAIMMVPSFHLFHGFFMKKKKKSKDLSLVHRALWSNTSYLSM